MPKPTFVRTTLVSAFLALAACTQPSAATGSTPAPAPATPPPAVVPSPAVALTPQGLGPMRIGMTDAEARAAAGAANIETDTGTEISESCTEIKLKGAYPGVYLMINDGKLSRISLWEGATITTDKGIGLGARPEDIQAAYPGIESSGHEYEDPPARYMTDWVTPQKEGVRFEINHSGVVSAIHAGDSTITYSEGCA